MRRRLPLLAAALGLLSVSATANAAIVLSANLTNAAENPPATPTTTSTGAPRPASFGTATMVLNDAQTAMTFSTTFFNIDVTGTQTPNDANDNLTVAHIHAGPTVTPTTNGPVVWGFFGTPFNDNNPNDQVVTPFATGVGGTIIGKWDAPEGNNTTLAAQIASLLNGRAYVNIHTTQFPGGEIRGTIVASVPEPSALLLSGAALVGFGFFRRKARRIEG